MLILYDLKDTRKKAFFAELDVYLWHTPNSMFSHLVVYMVCFFILPGQEYVCAQINCSIFMPVVALINTFINTSLCEKHDKLYIWITLCVCSISSDC